MKKIIFLVGTLILCAVASAEAAPVAKEISFKRDCAAGVPLYDAATGKIACGTVSASGVGYILEMAMPGNSAPSCPSGFNYIGDLDKLSLAARGIVGRLEQTYFACARG